MSEIVNTKRTVVLRRVPPGDRWSPVDDPNTVLDSLTEGLEHVFQSTQLREYHLSPLSGFVYKVEEVDSMKDENINDLKMNLLYFTIVNINYKIFKT